MRTARNLAILIFEDVEMLDFCGPFEVFSKAEAVLSVCTGALLLAKAGLLDGLDPHVAQRLPPLDHPEILER